MHCIAYGILRRMLEVRKFIVLELKFFYCGKFAYFTNLFYQPTSCPLHFHTQACPFPSYTYVEIDLLIPILKQLYLFFSSQSDITDGASSANSAPTTAATAVANSESVATNGIASTESGHLRRPSQTFNNNGSGNGAPTFAVPSAPAPASNYATM